MNSFVNQKIPIAGWQMPASKNTDRIWFFFILPLIVGAITGLLMLVSPWLALGVVLLVALLVAALLKPVLLCYLVVFGVALTSGMERGKPVPNLRLNEVIFAFCFAIAFVVMLVRKNRTLIKLDSLGVAILILVTGTSIIPSAYYLISGASLTIQDAIILLSPLQYVLLFLMFVYLPDSNAERLAIIKLMLFCAAIVAVIGLLQALKVRFVLDFLHDWFSSRHQAVALRENRITSLLGSWNGLGVFMLVNLLIIWTFGVANPASMGWLVIILEGAAMVACLLLSGSLAGMLGLLLGIAIVSALLGLFTNRRNILLFLLVAAVLVVTFIFFTDRVISRYQYQFGYGGYVPATLIGRFSIWQNIYLPVIQKNFLWGVNPTIPSNFAWQYTESQYFELLFTSGMIGLVAFLAWNTITLTALFRALRRHVDVQRLITAINIALLVVLLVAGFTNAVFTYSGTADYLWIMLALIATTTEPRQGIPAWSVPS